MAKSNESNHLETTMKKAVIEMLLLKILSEGDAYGYQMSQELKKRSAGNFSILEGSMYPILYRLLDAGYITDRQEKVGRRMIRVYYHLEPKGKAYLGDLIGRLDKYIDMIHFLLDSKTGDVYERGADNE